MGSPAVLLVADLFNPLDGFTVETFLNGDMRHTRGCRGSMTESFPFLQLDRMEPPLFHDSRYYRSLVP